MQERSWQCLAHRCKTVSYDLQGFAERLKRCPPWQDEELTLWTQQQLCGLLRLHLGLAAQAHGTQMTSHLPETETVPAILVLASVCEPGQAGVLAKPGAS